MIPLSRRARLDRVDLLRRAAAAGATPTNGIVGLEVAERGGRLYLDVEFVTDLPAAPANVHATDVTITGGVRRPEVAVTRVRAEGRVLHVQVARRGDFSDYTLRLARDGAPLPGFDPLLSEVVFGFRRECDADLDCGHEPATAVRPLPTAPIDHTARDYQGFRRLMLDRLAVLMPDWSYPGEASPEVTLLEVLAHTADLLAYAQDAVATESYLDTARLRTSAKRHARLVDYAMHDGCNARTVVHVRLRTPRGGEPPVTAGVRTGARFLTRTEGAPPAGADDPVTQQARLDGAVVFEAMADAELTSRHNRILVHDFQGALTVLPAGATTVAVADPGRVLALAAGDLVLLEEVADPVTGDAAPRPERRHVVRLTGAVPGLDPVGRTDDAGDPAPLELLHLEWDVADALPIELPLARVTTTDRIDGIDPGPDQPTLVARGNLVPVDHGESAGEDVVLPQRRPGRRRVSIPLGTGSVTQQLALDPLAPAVDLFRADPATALPALTASQTTVGGVVKWDVVRDFIAPESGTDNHLVLDVETAAPTVLRSGNDEADEQPEADVPMVVRYRVGNGHEGDIGAEALAHLVTDGGTDLDGTFRVAFAGSAADVELVRNPLPARGCAPESIAEVRLRAPIMFTEPRRAVTGADYARFLEAHPQVAGARALERWTGSWRCVVLLVDLVGGAALAPLEPELRQHLEPVRLAGHALEFREPVLVPLELSLRICVAEQVPRTHVEERIMALFSARVLPDGSLGLFHPDRFGFGDPVRLSRLVAAAQGVDGVRSVEVTGLTRQGGTGPTEDVLGSGTMTFGAYEIPVLANDPTFPDRGRVVLTTEGGA